MLNQNGFTSCNLDKEEETASKKTSIIKSNSLNNQLNYQYLFKLALIGDSGSGKTSILLRFTEDTFNENTQFTIGVDFKIVSMNINDNLVKIQLWDTCGSERFKSLTTSFIKSCTAFILVFDITRMKTFKSLEFWMKVVKESTKEHNFLCLIGNKSDLDSKRQVPIEKCIEFAKSFGLKYMETSAKNNVNIMEVFCYVAEILYNKKKKDLSTEITENNINQGEIINVNEPNNNVDPKNKVSGCRC